MYKTESILGLTGSIIAAVFTALCVAGTVLVVVFIDTLGPWIFNIVERYAVVKDWMFVDWSSGVFVSLATTAIIVCAAVGVIIASASFILGFIGTSKLRSEDKSGGVLLIVAAAISFISVIGFIPFVLFLIGGIMAVSKRQPAQQADIIKAD